MAELVQSGKSMVLVSKGGERTEPDRIGHCFERSLESQLCQFFVREYDVEYASVTFVAQVHRGQQTYCRVAEVGQLTRTPALLGRWLITAEAARFVP
jgi:hypothetical protein